MRLPLYVAGDQKKLFFVYKCRTKYTWIKTPEIHLNLLSVPSIFYTLA